METYYARNKASVQVKRKERIEKRKTVGVCYECGKNPVDRDRSSGMCSLCLDRNKGRADAYRKVTDKTKIQASQKKAQDKKPSLYRSIKKKYYDNHKDKWKKYLREYRARKYKAVGNFTQQEWEELLEFYNYACLCCGATESIEADHVTPISKGGSDSIGNIQPLCKTCNREKWDKTIDYRPAYFQPKPAVERDGEVA